MCQGEERAVLEAVVADLRRGIPARAIQLSEHELFSKKSMGLLMLKPVLYAFNVDEDDFTLGRPESLASMDKTLNSIQYCDSSKDMFAIVSVKFQADMTTHDKDEQLEYLTSLHMELKNGQIVEDLLSQNVLPTMAKQILNLSLAYSESGVSLE